MAVYLSLQTENVCLVTAAQENIRVGLVALQCEGNFSQNENPVDFTKWI